MSKPPEDTPEQAIFRNIGRVASNGPPSGPRPTEEVSVEQPRRIGGKAPEKAGATGSQTRSTGAQRQYIKLSWG